MRYHIALAGVVLSAGLLVSAPQAHASLTEAQVQSVQQLLTSFGVDSKTFRDITNALRGATTQTVSNDTGCTGSSTYSTTTGRRCSAQTASTSTASSCPSLSYDLSVGSTDLRTNGEVSLLQKFLGGQVTGYFGAATKALVLQWQQGHGVMASGYVGSQTRSAILRSCGGAESSTTSSNSCVLYQIPLCASDEHVERGPTDADGCAGAPRCVRNSTNAPSCPLYQTPICGSGYHVEMGPADGSGCSAPRCVADSTGGSCPVYQTPICASGEHVEMRPDGSGCSRPQCVSDASAMKCGVNSVSVSSRCTADGYYSAASIQCYDGNTQELGGLDSTCRTASEWRSEAQSACSNRCSAY